MKALSKKTLKLPEKHHPRSPIIVISRIVVLALILSFLPTGCSGDEGQGTDNPSPSGSKQITGTVKDESGQSYPGTSVTASKGTESITRTTDSNGKYTLNTKDTGSYQVEFELPLSTEAVSPIRMNVNVKENTPAQLDLIIRPKEIDAHLNFGNVDIFNEIRDTNGNSPSASSTPIYAANFFQEPIGLLTAIKTPEDRHLTLGEWKMAKGNFNVSCNGNTAEVQISLQGLIPNGTYTFWLAFLNKTKKVGQTLGLPDFVNAVNPPLKSGTDNIQIADAEGNIEATIVHPSCILTQEKALVIPVIYHINGRTFGSGEIPDIEEVSHLLVYFQ